jgi:hypothetical protein
MNLELKEKVWRSDFYATEASAVFEEKLRSAFGLSYRYEAAQLLIGRSLREPQSPDPLPSTTKFTAKSIPGKNLFGENLDLWLCALILDGRMQVDATFDDFRTLVEAHWARGFRLIADDLDVCQGNELRLVQRLADLLPETSAPVDVPFGANAGPAGEIRLKVGSISQTHPAGKPVEFVLNGPGTPPHIALMGANGKGKTTTGVQMALELAQSAQIPLLFLDLRASLSPTVASSRNLQQSPVSKEWNSAHKPVLLTSSHAPMRQRKRSPVPRCDCATPLRCAANRRAICRKIFCAPRSRK